MALNLDECIKKIQEIYPDMYPTYYVNYKGKYLFSLAPRGVDRRSANMEFRMLDPEDGGASSSIPLDYIMKDKELVALLNKPHKIDPDQQRLEHGIKIRGPYSGDSGQGHYYGITRTSDYLKHHGIKGQRWGEKNGPPYPLDAKTHKEVVSGAEKTKSKSNASEVVGDIDPELAAFAVEASALALFFIGTAIYIPIKKNKNHKEWKKQNDEISEDYLSDISDIKQFSEDDKPREIKGEHSREDDMAAVNPKYGTPTKGSSNNCALCTIAYEFRRRGYDVNAKLCSTGMYSDKLVQDMFEGTKKLDDMGGRNWSAVYKKFEKKYPEGSRGMICVSSIFGGHAMAFEIQNGKMEIYDAQSATKRKLTDAELSYFDPSATTAIRLDDKKPKWENAGVACAQLKPDWKKTMAKLKKESNANGNKESKKTKKVESGLNDSKINLAQIKAYKKEHPGTQLSDTEILKRIFNK